MTVFSIDQFQETDEDADDDMMEKRSRSPKREKKKLDLSRQVIYMCPFLFIKMCKHDEMR
jgi:hypothetical protein